MIIVLLDSFIFSKTDIISSVVLLSSAPVGSSTSITDGSLTIARAIAARCFCPPDSLLQCLSACSFIPTSSSALCAVFLLSLGLFFAKSRGSNTLFYRSGDRGCFVWDGGLLGGYDEKGGAVYPDTASSLANLTGRSGRSSALPYPPCE